MYCGIPCLMTVFSLFLLHAPTMLQRKRDSGDLSNLRGLEGTKGETGLEKTINEGY